MKKLIIIFFVFAFFALPQKASAATYTVTKTADTLDGTCDADCSLREAITAVNANAGHDTIEFDIPISDGGYVEEGEYFIVQHTATHFVLTDDSGVFINGYSQEGAARNTASFGETLNTIIKIQINQGNAQWQLQGSNNHITGLNISRTNASLMQMSSGSSNNWIEGNYIGSDITGMSSTGRGGTVTISHAADPGDENIVGTDGDGVGDKGEMNLIINGLSWSNGIVSMQGGDGHVIAGNYIGVDKTGRQCATENTNRQIIGYTEGATNARVGTNYDGVSDTIEANILGCVTAAKRGVVRVLGQEGGVLQGNYIGTNPHGDALSNFEIPGVRFQDTVSGTFTIKGNVIASNNGEGVSIANASTGITIRENRIHGNTLIGIDLVSGGQGGPNDGLGVVTPNDPGDTDTGPNDLMNHPEIHGARYIGGGKYDVWGKIDGNLSEAPFTIEICKSSLHSSGYGGCSQSLGTTTTSTTSWNMEVTVSGDNENNLSTFSALATNANGSTSEFSPNRGPEPINVIPTSPESTSPDLLANTAGIAANDDVLVLVGTNIIPWDSYLYVAKSLQTGVYRIPGTNYWQASPVYEIWFKSFFNDARILPQELARPFTLALRYSPHQLEPMLSETRLRLAYSGDEGKTWRVLSSVLDVVNKTVAVVTKNGGHYMLVSGY